MEIIVGTAGHIDHGKTSLVKALTGIDADRLPEEKRRGITVDLGFAEMGVGEAHFGFVDVPGHERFVKNMLAGASGMDLVILVIAADDGVMPQTREHFDICRLLNVRSGIVAITKCDLVDAETLELAKLEAAELVENSFLANAPIIPVSSRSGEGVDAIRDALADAANRLATRQNDLVTRLPIDRSFSMKGFGAVVTGTLASGSITEGSELELLPISQRVRVRGLQTHGKSVTTAHAGQRVAVNIAGVDHADVERGMLLAEPGVLSPTQIIDAEIEVVAGATRHLRTRQRIRLHIGTAEVLARVRVLSDTGEIAAGQKDFAQLTFEMPVVVIAGERFIIRSYSPQLTIAGGVVIDTDPVKHRRREFSDIHEYLSRLVSTDDLASKIAFIVDRRGTHGVTRTGIKAQTGANSTHLADAIKTAIESKLIVEADNYLIGSRHAGQLSDTAIATVEQFHKKQPLGKGMPRESLRETVFANIPDEIFQHVVSGLIGNGKLIADNETIRSATFQNVLSDADAKVSKKLADIFAAAGLEVPKLDEAIAASIAGTAAAPQHARKLFQQFLDSGDIIKVTDEFYFSRTAIDELTNKLRKFADDSADRLVDVAAFKDLAGVSRKYAIPLLEYFDRVKVTTRAGDKRVIL